MFARAAALLAAQPEQETAQIFRADYGTTVRDAAALLTLSAETGSQVVDREALAMRLAARAGALSTQEAAWTLLAAHALAEAGATDGLTVDGQPASGPVIRVMEQDAIVPVSIANTGPRDTTLTVTTFGVPEVPEPPGGNGYAITRTYFTLDGQPPMWPACRPDAACRGARGDALCQRRGAADGRRPASGGIRDRQTPT